MGNSPIKKFNDVIVCASEIGLLRLKLEKTQMLRPGLKDKLLL